MRRVSILCAGLLAAASWSFGAVIIDKTPDQDAYWGTLSSSGAYIFANSFVAPVSAQLNLLGIYMVNSDAGVDPSEFLIQIWADNLDSPDASNILGTTGVLTQPSLVLARTTSSLLAPVNIVAGTRYWIIATTVGLGGSEPYTVGGHTQNSIYNDNGTFWYSNDGVSFDGQGPTPEMAIYAEGDLAGSPAPEPATWGMMAMGFGALAAWRKRR